MNADAVSFPKGVFPPDADFGKGGHVPMKHPTGVGESRGGEPLVSPLWGDSFGSFLLAAEKNTSISSEFATAAACQRQRTLLNKKAAPAGFPARTAKNNLI